MVKIPTGMPQNIPTNPAKQGVPAGSPTPIPIEVQIPVDQIGDFPTGGKSVAPKITPEKIVNQLNVLIQNITVKSNVVIADKGDIDVNIPGKPHLDMSNLDKMFPSVGNFILETKEPAPKQFKPIFVGLKAVGEAIRAGQHSSFPTICQKPKPEGRVFAPKHNIGDNISGQSLKPEFIAHFKTFTTQNLPQDPMAFIQWVLRESYLETTECLYDYAEKVQFFNEQKKAVRLEAEGVRNNLAKTAGTPEDEKGTTNMATAIKTKNYSLDYTPATDPNLIHDNIENGNYDEQVDGKWVAKPVGGTTGAGQAGSAGSAGIVTDLDLQDPSVKAAVEALANDSDGQISGDEMLSVLMGARDKDSKTATTEFDDLVKFYEANKANMSPEAQAMFEHWHKEVSAYKAANPGATGVKSSVMDSVFETLNKIADPTAGYAADKAATDKITLTPPNKTHKSDGEGSSDMSAIDTSSNKATASLLDYYNNLGTQAEKDAFIKALETDGISFKMFVEEVDPGGKGQQWYADNNDTKTITKTYTKLAGQSVEDFLNDAAAEMTQQGKNFVSSADGGDSEMGRCHVTITPPDVSGVEVPKYTDAQLAEMYPTSGEAQSAGAAQSVGTGGDIGVWQEGEDAVTIAEGEAYLENLEETLNTLGDDAQLANVDLQNWLQKQQQTLQMMSNISKMLQDTAMAVIRKIG